MRTFGTETDNLIDLELSEGQSNYEITWYHNGVQRDISVTKAVIHFVGSKTPIGQITKHYIELNTEYLGFLENDAIKIDITKNNQTITIGTYYVTDFDKGDYNASYTAFSSTFNLDIAIGAMNDIPQDVMENWRTIPIDYNAKTIKEIVHYFIDPLGIKFDTEPGNTILFAASVYQNYENMTLRQLLSFCACMEGCNYVLYGNTLHKVVYSKNITKSYNIDEVVYSENISQKKSDTILDYIKLKYKKWLYEGIDRGEDPMYPPADFVEEEVVLKNSTQNNGFEIISLLIPVSSVNLKTFFQNYFNSIYGMDYNTYTISFFGDARPQVGDTLKFYNDDKEVVFNACNIIWEWDGGLKCTATSEGEESSVGGTSNDGVTIPQLVVQLEAVTNALKNVQFNSVSTQELYASVANLGFATIDELVVEVAQMGYMTAEEVDIRYLTANNADLKYASIGSLTALQGEFTALQSKAITTDNLSASIAELGYLNAGQADIAYAKIDFSNVSKASIGQMFADVGLITEAVIVDGHVTGCLDSVEVNAESITAGTLSVERLEIRGSKNSIVYALNNITGALESTQVDTLNGDILTDRTITGKKLIAQSVTTTELAAGSVTADKILVNALSSVSANLGIVTAGIIQSSNYSVNSSGVVQAGMQLNLASGVWKSKYTTIENDGSLFCSNITINKGCIDILDEYKTSNPSYISIGKGEKTSGGDYSILKSTDIYANQISLIDHNQPQNYSRNISLGEWNEYKNGVATTRYGINISNVVANGSGGLILDAISGDVITHDGISLRTLNSNLSSILTTKTFSVRGDSTVHYISKAVDISLDGYTPIAIAGWGTVGVGAYLYTNSLSLSGNTLSAIFTHPNGVTLTSAMGANVKVLYVKNDFV